MEGLTQFRFGMCNENVRTGFLILVTFGLFVGNLLPCYGARSTPLIVDHRHTDIWQVPEYAITQAKAGLHIAYGHTSHGSQLITGMGGTNNLLDEFMSSNGATPGVYTWNDGPQDGALDLDDYAMGGDVGYYPDWIDNTRDYLGDADPLTGRGTLHSDVNVVVWSWCGQVSSYTEEMMVRMYLQPMSELEEEYPGIIFVYMTGHLDGTGSNGNLHQRNEQIRVFCRENNKVLYDFADIESYDPDGSMNYMKLMANDNCDYDIDGDGSRESNWAQDWQGSHIEGVDWWPSTAAHSQFLNGNLKGYAAWWLWSSLAGWNDPEDAVKNVVAVLQLLAGIDIELKEAGPDINRDSYIGMAEAIDMLRVAAGLE